MRAHWRMCIECFAVWETARKLRGNAILFSSKTISRKISSKRAKSSLKNGYIKPANWWQAYFRPTSSWTAERAGEQGLGTQRLESWPRAKTWEGEQTFISHNKHLDNMVALDFSLISYQSFDFCRERCT